jgi:hypothetical protein
MCIRVSEKKEKGDRKIPKRRGEILLHLLDFGSGGKHVIRQAHLYRFALERAERLIGAVRVRARHAHALACVCVSVCMCVTAKKYQETLGMRTRVRKWRVGV